MPQNDSDHPDAPARESLERRLEAVERALADDEPLERAGRLDDLKPAILLIVIIGRSVFCRA